MHRIYQFILDSVNQGHTILAYDRSVANPHVYHIKDASRVTLCGDVLHVDGVPAKGWTVCRKP